MSADGILYLLFGAVPIIFEQGKGWTPVQVSFLGNAAPAPRSLQMQASLPFLAVLLGTLFAAAFNFAYSKYVFGPYLDRHGGSAKPEMRLPPMSASPV